jgi:hypothetical protein
VPPRLNVGSAETVVADNDVGVTLASLSLRRPGGGPVLEKTGWVLLFSGGFTTTGRTPKLIQKNIKQW